MNIFVFQSVFLSFAKIHHLFANPRATSAHVTFLLSPDLDRISVEQISDSPFFLTISSLMSVDQLLPRHRLLGVGKIIQ